MSGDVESLSEAELVVHARLRPWEARVETLGCLAAPLLSALVVYPSLVRALGWPRAPAGWLIIAALGLIPVGVVSLVLYLAARDQAERRSRPFEAELSRRWGQAPLETYIAEARLLMAGDDPPDWLLLMRGTGPPRGQDQFVRLTLRAWKVSRGVLEARRGKRFSAGSLREGVPEIEDGEVELSPAECARLLRLLGGLELPLRDVPSRVRDGYRCGVAVLRREPALVSRAECFVAGLPEGGLPEGGEGLAAARVAQELLRLAEERLWLRDAASGNGGERESG